MQILQKTILHIFAAVALLYRCIMACHGRRDLKLTDTFSGDAFLRRNFFSRGEIEQSATLIFPATINLQYGIRALSRPEAARYCFILLVSYYQQSQSTPTAPHTQSRFYITSIRRCTNAENIWRQPWELCFLRGWEGLFFWRGPSAGLLCVCSLGWAAVTPWGPLISVSITIPPPPIWAPFWNVYRRVHEALDNCV